MTHYSVIVAIEKEAEDEGYAAYSPTLPGCFSNGRTVEEAKRNIRDAIRLHIESLLAHGQPGLATWFVNEVLSRSGDYEAALVLRFYAVYRALVRAKVAAIRAGQSAGSERACALRACRSHLRLAQRCLSDSRPALIITHGLPGSGKTTFAQYVIEQLGAVRIRSDVERKRLFGLSSLEGSRKLNVDIYSRQATEQTYARLLLLARDLLRAGHTVVVDAAFLQHEEREQFRALAREAASPFVIATLDADAQILRERLRQRRKDASEADVSVLEKLQSVQQPLSAREREDALRFNTMRPPQSGENARSWHHLLKFVYVQ